MKIVKQREDHVTNSSSTSYICTACGTNVTDYDISLEDSEMCECTSNHTFCEGHMRQLNVTEEHFMNVILKRLKDEDIDTEENRNLIKKVFEEDFSYYGITDFSCIKDFFLTLSEKDEYLADLLYIKRESLPEELCPICNLFIIQEENVLKYLLCKYNITLNEVKEEIRNQYSTCNELEYALMKQGKKKGKKI